MAQIKIYGYKTFLSQKRQIISDAIHTCSVKTLGLPEAKRFHRFIDLESENFYHPDDRSDQYLILEVHMFEGRKIATKKAFIQHLISNLTHTLSMHPNDVEITLIESPPSNWGIRGKTGDELQLNYKIQQ